VVIIYTHPNLVTASTTEYTASNGAEYSSIQKSRTITLKVHELGAGFADKYINDRFNPKDAHSYVISGWIKDGFNNDYTDKSGDVHKQFTYKTSGSVTINGDGVNVDCLSDIDQAPFIDGWQRFEVVFQIDKSTNSNEITLSIDGGDFGLYVDDIRIYPYKSNMKTFVYDPYVMRLSAELDENNYATFYDYDFEGNLIRIRKETERGIMTIQESKKHSYK
jgi:hypothetical protein